MVGQIQIPFSWAKFRSDLSVPYTVVLVPFPRVTLTSIRNATIAVHKEFPISLLQGAPGEVVRCMDSQCKMAN